MKGAKIVFLVYDVTNMESFQNITEWYKKLDKANSGTAPIGKILDIFLIKLKNNCDRKRLLN